MFLESGDDISSRLSATVEVIHIPDDYDDKKITMIFENKRYTGVADALVTDVHFAEDDHSRAFITFSSPEGFCFLCLSFCCSTVIWKTRWTIINNYIQRMFSKL